VTSLCFPRPTFKSVLPFQHDAPPFLFKETNHVFAFAPNDRGP